MVNYSARLDQASSTKPARGTGHKALAILNNSVVTTSQQIMASATGTQGEQSSSIRQIGTICQVLPKYGFVRCSNDNAKIFFHDSEYKGTLDHLKQGDSVEFEVGFHEYTGKPMAKSVIKITPDIKSGPDGYQNGIIIYNEGDAKFYVKFDDGGTCYFLNFSDDDVVGGLKLSVNDKVKFLFYTDNRGLQKATSISLDASR